jgi:hypothetical protein
MSDRIKGALLACIACLVVAGAVAIIEGVLR